MFKIFLPTVFALACATPAFGAILAPTAGSKVIEGVTVDAGATASLDSGTITLTTVGAGLRSKTVPILGAVKVYVGELMVSDVADFNRAAALSSFDKENAVAAVFTFKRALDIGQITGAFQDMFTANKIDYSTGPVAQFLQVVSTVNGIKSGDKMAIIGEKLANGTEEIHFQAPDNSVQTVKGPAGFVKEIFNFWFGQVNNDKGLTQFQQAVLAAPAAAPAGHGAVQ